MAVPFGRTDDGNELHFGTNHLGHFLLVGRLLPLLVASAPSRVVVLSSGGHAMSDIDWDDPNYEQREYSKMAAYGQSKTANILHDPRPPGLDARVPLVQPQEIEGKLVGLGVIGGVQPLVVRRQRAGEREQHRGE